MECSHCKRPTSEKESRIHDGQIVDLECYRYNVEIPAEMLAEMGG